MITKACGTHSSPLQDISILIMSTVCMFRDEKGSNNEVAMVVSKGTGDAEMGKEARSAESRDRVSPLAHSGDVILSRRQHGRLRYTTQRTGGTSQRHIVTSRAGLPGQYSQACLLHDPPNHIHVGKRSLVALEVHT
jgi:hypothetical protein